MRQEKSCGAVITKICDGKRLVLLIKHKNGHHWAFPKGHVELGETEIETATREILEETGLHADIDPNFRTVVTYSPQKNTIKDVIYFAATTGDDTAVAQPEEVEKVLWVDIEDASEKVTFKNDRDVLTKYKEFIG